jgi:hypothetical protein
MYVIIRDSVTNANVKVDSLTGFVKGTPVQKEFLGTPLSETSPKQGMSQLAQPSTHYVLTTGS